MRHNKREESLYWSIIKGLMAPSQLCSAARRAGAPENGAANTNYPARGVLYRASLPSTHHPSCPNTARHLRAGLSKHPLLKLPHLTRT